MIKYLINAISKGLAFSKNEARGTFILALIIVLVLGFSQYASYRIKSTEPEPYDSTLLASWVSEIESSYSVKETSNFEPTLSEPRSFVKKEKEIFPEKPPDVQPDEKKEELPILDINNATAEELQEVKGIGKVYSERIIKYRTSLGGFSSLIQLKEVYGLKDETIEGIKERFTIQSKNLPLPINSDSVKTLIKHPYISYDMAWVIINYRKQNGDISNFEDLKKIKAIDDSLLIKLRPYIE